MRTHLPQPGHVHSGEALDRVALGRRHLIGGAVAAGLWPWAPFAAATQACEFFTDTLRVTHPWTRATGDGDDSAVLCLVMDQVQRADRLIGVRTPVAGGAEMAGATRGLPVDIRVEPGQTLEFTEQGLHVRLTPLLRQLHAGREFELELHFDSGVLLTTLSVDFPKFRFL